MGHCVSCFRMIDTICDEKEKDKLADIPSKKDDVIDTVGSVPERAVPLATVSMNHPLLADGPAAKEGATAARPPSRFLKAKKAESTRSYDTSNMISETEELLDSSSNGASLTDREVMEGVSTTAVAVAAEAEAETAQRISDDSSLDDSLDSDDPKHLADTATESSADTFARCAPPGLTPDSEIVDSIDERLSENGSGGEKRADSPLSSADNILPTSCPPPPGLDISPSGDTVPNPFVLDDDVPPPHLPQRSQESLSPKAADSADANGPSPAPLTTPSASISPPPGLGFKDCSAERSTLFESIITAFIGFPVTFPHVLHESADGSDVVAELSAAERKQQYMDKLVQLGLERQALEDNEIGPSSATVRVRGHDFELQSSRGRHNPCCEICMCTIWRLVQSWRRCNSCGMRVHDKCASDTHRICASVIASHRDFSLSQDMRPELGLAAQNYRCAECQTHIIYDGPAHMEPRLCDYTRRLFCPSCHWGDQWAIPARVLMNMDASPRPVCRAVKQLLSIVDSRPLISLGTGQSVQTLVKYHKDLKRVQQLRLNFLYMKCFFISCRNARKLRILQYLNRHQHFVENSTMYSLKELRELCQGELLQELEDIYLVFKRHIEEECEICQGKGFYCMLCDASSSLKNEVLFPFSSGVSTCQECLAVYHKTCFERKSFHCVRCELRRKRLSNQPPVSTSALYSIYQCDSPACAETNHHHQEESCSSPTANE